MVYADGSNPSVRKDIGFDSLSGTRLSSLTREVPAARPKNAVVKPASPDFSVRRV